MTERVLLVTGLSGAGKTTALKTFENLGWETADNLPLGLLDRLLKEAPVAGEGRPLALGIGSATRGFDAARLLREARRRGLELLFLDCPDAELEQRFSATRQRHPLAADRPAALGIAEDRALLSPLRDAADHLIDTGGLSTNALQAELRQRFGPSEVGTQGATSIAVTSFAFSRGVPRDADLVFDMRFLRNPHWDETLRPLTGEDEPVGAYIAADPAYVEALERIEALLLLLLPRYAAEGKSYVTVAFGCTGGKHRSVHTARRVAARLREAGFSLTLRHRDLALARGRAVDVAGER